MKRIGVRRSAPDVAGSIRSCPYCAGEEQERPQGLSEGVILWLIVEARFRA